MKRTSRLWIVVVTVAVATAACAGAEPPPEPAAAGEQVFADNCAACHGTDLNGTDQGPPLLHDYYKACHHGDEAFRTAVVNGVQPHHWQFGPMPPVAGMSKADTEAVIDYIRVEQQAAGTQ